MGKKTAAKKSGKASKAAGAKKRKAPVRKVAVTEMRAPARTREEKAAAAKRMAAFGKRLRAARKRAGLTQYDVARLARVTQPHISNVEAGRLPASKGLEARMLAAIAKAAARSSKKAA